MPVCLQNFDDVMVPTDHVSRSPNDTYYVDKQTVSVNSQQHFYSCILLLTVPLMLSKLQLALCISLSHMRCCTPTFRNGSKHASLPAAAVATGNGVWCAILSALKLDVLCIARALTFQCLPCHQHSVAVAQQSQCVCRSCDVTPQHTKQSCSERERRAFS